MKSWRRRRVVAIALMVFLWGINGSPRVRAQEGPPARFDARAAGFAVSQPASELPAAQPETGPSARARSPASTA